VINGSALQWFRSYLVGRTQRVRHGAAISSDVHLVCGVPRGSVIGPILLVVYTADPIALVRSYDNDSRPFCFPVPTKTLITTVWTPVVLVIITII